MKTFKQFISEAVRQGLPHISKMDHKQLGSLLSRPHISFDQTTEKTDGTSFVMGHDNEGFYTQSTGSGKEKMRSPEDYHERGRRRAKERGIDYDPFMNNRFGEVHKALQSNESFQKALKHHHDAGSGQDTVLRGELFHNKIAQPSDEAPGHVKYVGTSYEPKKLNAEGRNLGSVIIHTKLPENHWVDHNTHPQSWSDHNIGFGHDVISHNVPHLDVSDHKQAFDSLDHETLAKRAAGKDKEAVLNERAKVATIANSLHNKVDEHISKHKIEPKFGVGTEGLVVHSNPVRFKITSDAFRKFKEDTKGMDVSQLRGQDSA